LLKNDRCQELQQQIEDLIVNDSSFRRLEELLFRFCPFEAMGAVNAELRHANFLAYLLDPLRPHNFGDAVLRSFLKSVIAETGPETDLTPLRIHLMDLRSVEIRREWRGIDLLIILPVERVVFCLEMKVGTKQHGDQLRRYRKIIEQHWTEWTHVFLFLRPTAEEAEDDPWINLGFETIVTGLEQIQLKLSGDDCAKSLLNAYTQMIRREFVTDEELQELATSLWKKHKEALMFLSDNEPDELSDLLRFLRENDKEICDEVSSANLTLVPDHHAGNTMLRFGVLEWDELKDGMTGQGWTKSGRILLIEIQRFHRKNSEGLRVLLVLGPTSSSVRQEIFSALIPHMKSGNRKLSDKWKRIYNAPVFTLDENDEEFDVENAAEQVKSELKGFVEGLLNRISKSLISAAGN
jgi:hypothetical protein